MPAIITDPFKKFIIQHLYDDVFDSSQVDYYVGIGRSQDWDSSDTVVLPTRNSREERNFRLSLQSVKKTSLASFVIPRYNWTSGTIYTGYDDSVVGIPSNSYYVLTDDNSVYICLQQGRDANGNPVPSVNKPTSASTAPVTLADGYTWKLLYTVSGLRSSRFLTSNYIPIQLQDATDSSSTAIQIEQYQIQQTAVNGSISSIAVLNAGTGYTSAPTVTISGNGSGAKAAATVANGTISKIEIIDSSGTFMMGSGYDYATVNIVGGSGSGATARAILSPGEGFGADPRVDLKSSSIMYNVALSGAENDDFIIGQDFRQVGLIKGVKKATTDSDYVPVTGSALKKINLSSVSAVFTADRTIQGGTSGATAYIDRYDTVNRIIYYHQTETTGFLSFANGEVVSETNGSGSGIIDSSSLGDINIWSGDVYYIENRAAIERDAASTEDVKIVIQL